MKGGRGLLIGGFAGIGLALGAAAALAALPRGGQLVAWFLIIGATLSLSADSVAETAVDALAARRTRRNGRWRDRRQLIAYTGLVQEVARLAMQLSGLLLGLEVAGVFPVPWGGRLFAGCLIVERLLAGLNSLLGRRTRAAFLARSRPWWVPLGWVGDLRALIRERRARRAGD